MPRLSGATVDGHCHVGLRGEVWPELGYLGRRFLDSPAAKIFMAYTRVPADRFTDPVLRVTTERVLSETAVDHVVCLALDQLHEEDGREKGGDIGPLDPGTEPVLCSVDDGCGLYGDGLTALELDGDRLALVRWSRTTLQRDVLQDGSLRGILDAI